MTIHPRPNFKGAWLIETITGLGAKPLSEPMLEYYWLNPYEQNSMKS